MLVPLLLKLLHRHVRKLIAFTHFLLSTQFRYIFLGAVLFNIWEKWGYLDGSYFCFISLSSIGFGDLVPGAAVSEQHN
jgi:hypothetical protein